MQTIDKNQAIELIQKSKGRVFSAVFTKKDGSQRYINCRTGVTKHLTGSGMAYNAKAKGLLPVWDLQKKDYRMLNLNTLQTLKINKNEYRIGTVVNLKKEVKKVSFIQKIVNFFKKD